MNPKESVALAGARGRGGGEVQELELLSSTQITVRNERDMDQCVQINYIRSKALMVFVIMGF